MSEDMKKIMAFLESDDYKTAQKLAEKSIKEMVEMQDKAEKWDKYTFNGQNITPEIIEAVEEAQKAISSIRKTLALWAGYEYPDYPILKIEIRKLIKEISASLNNQEVRT